MAEIGVMKKLTIGGKTYTIPEYSLPIASASTLGGVRVGTGLVIESGTGILSATGTDVTIDSEMSDSSTNPVQNQVIKAYIDQYKGTVTSVRVQATSPVQSSTSTAQSSSLNTTISLANGYGDTKNPYGTKTANYVLAGPTSGNAAAPSFRELVAADIPDLSETYLTSYTETDPTVPSWAKASSKPTYTASEVGAASSSHTHGNITNGGDITATAPTIANGDQIIINDNSASKITNGPTFDGSTTTTALTPKGTWESFSKFSGSYNDLSNKPTIPTVPTVVSAFTNDAGYITSADVPEGASAYTGTISAVSTTASNGTNNGFARGDHVHNITSSTITSALGYTPYDSTNPNGYISSYTDEKLKWTASTSSNTYYPLQSTSTATTSTANTLNGISFYQYYNTAGGYRRLILGNSTAYTSTGGAYGTIRLYGTGATYYGDINPGTLGANRTWTLPNATGTIALTSDIPDVSSFITDAGVTKITTTEGTHSAITNATGAVSFNVPTKTSHLTNDSNFVTSSGVTSITLKAGDGISLDTDNTAITTTGTRTISHADTSSQASSSNSGRTYIQSITLDTYGHVTGISTATESVTNTDTKLQVAAITSGTTYYPIVGTGTTAATRQYDTTGFVYVGTNGTANGSNGNALLTLGNSTASTTANWKKGTVRLYGTTAYYTDLVSGAPSANRTITFPNATGTVALTSDIPTVSYPVTSVNSKTGAVSLTASDVGALASSTTYVSTITTTAGTHSAISSKSGAVSFNVPTKTSHLTNDSNFITGITKSDVTTALGTGSGTTKFLREDGTWATPSYTTNTDTKLQVAEVTSATQYYPIVGTGTTAATRQYDTTGFKYKGTTGTTSAVGAAQLELGNSTASGTAANKQGKLVIYGSTAYAHTIQGAPTAARTLTLPNATGTIALTSDIPTTLPASDVSAWAKASTKPTYTASEVGALASDTTYVSTVTTTAGTHTAISNKSGAVSFNVPTKTSHLTNDSGFITSDSDEKVKSTPATAATTYYLIASTSSSENTATTSKHASIAAYTTADSGTSGYAELRLGNTTATSSAGGKEGTIRLYGTNATYYTTLKAGAVASSNKTITFPNATGTVALTSDLSNFVTSSGVTSIATTSPISGGTITGTGTISHATSGVGNAVTTAGFYKFKYDTYGHVTGVTAVAASDITGLVTIPTNTDEKVKSTTVTAATTYYLIGSTSSATETATTSKHGSVSISVGADSNTSGGSRITLGNSTAEGTAGAKYGYIRLYGKTIRYVDLVGGSPSANRTITFPDATGTVALTSNIPTALPVLTATGASTSTTISLANNTITQVPLTKTLINKAGVGNATISLETASNTIVIEGIGIYRVTASVYIKPASSVWCNVFIKQGNDNASFASATEKGSVAAYLSNSGGAINITQTIQTTNTTSCYVYLAARVSGTTGTVYTGNAATYLEVEQIG